MDSTHWRSEVGRFISPALCSALQFNRMVLRTTANAWYVLSENDPFPNFLRKIRDFQAFAILASDGEEKRQYGPGPSRGELPHSKKFSLSR
jgi:hypothetical protein